MKKQSNQSDTNKKLKRLNADKEVLEFEVKELLEDSKKASRKYEKARSSIRRIEEEIKTLKQKEITFSDHSILRYIERVMELDIEEIKNKILSEKTEKVLKSFVSGEFPIGDGIYAVMKDCHIITIYKK